MTVLAILAVAVAALAACAWRFAARRARAAEARAAALEAESLEQRRELWRLGKRAKSSGAAAPCDDAGPGRTAALDPLADAVAKIAGELAETRVLESLARGVVAAIGAKSARIVLHDRRTDRFARGPGARRADSGIEVGEEPPRQLEDAVLRCAMKRRARIERDGRDPALRSAFEPTASEVAYAVPLFDRAIASAVLVVEHDSPAGHGRAIDVLAAIGSLAYSNARLRATAQGGVDAAAAPETGGRRA